MSRPRAFTLLELLLAMALNLVLLAAIATATFVFLRGFQRADRDVVEAQLARAVFGRVGRDLRELCEEPPRSSAESMPAVDATEATSAGFERSSEMPPAVLRGSRSELQLLVRSDEPPTAPLAAMADAAEPAALEAAAWRVNYALTQAAADAGTTTAPPPGLTRQRHRWSADAMPSSALSTAPSEIADAELGVARPSRDYLHVEQIADLRLRYYDGAEWRDEWDSQLDGLPRALEIVLLFQRAPRGDSLLAAAVPDDAGLALPPGGYRMVLALERGAAPEVAGP